MKLIYYLKLVWYRQARNHLLLKDPAHVDLPYVMQRIFALEHQLSTK